jgi:uncharacterized protein (DUF2336 family)
MTDVADAGAELTTLARSRTPQDRERLLLGLADLCEAEPAADAPELLEAVFLKLVGEVEHDIRRRLAHRIADAAWAPRALVNILALDDIEIARPVIARSPLLRDDDLLRLLIETTLEHRIEVAARADLSEVVADAVVATAEPAVLSALARNGSARTSPQAMETLVLAARDLADLRAPLARHPRLTDALAGLLHGWVGSALREVLLARFRLAPAELDGALTEALRWTYDAAPPPPAFVSAQDRERMEERLVAKLHESGQLRPGTLLRALKDGKLGMFEAGLASLTGTTAAAVRAAVRSDRPELLALACAAIGIDRGAYPTVLIDLRRLTGGWPRTGTDSARRVTDAFLEHDAASARDAFQAAAIAA